MRRRLHDDPQPRRTAVYGHVLARLSRPRCIKSHDNYQRLRTEAKATTAQRPVAVQPVAVQVTTPERPLPIQASSAVQAAAPVPEQPVTTEVPVMEDADLGHSIFDAIRILRPTAGVA